MSKRNSFADSSQLFTIAADGSAGAGTFPDVLPLPMAEDGSYSPDGSHIAYQPVFHWQDSWKRYQGGQTLKIWLADLRDSSVVAIQRENSNDFNPMWVGDKVYFLSDRKGPVSLWSYDISARKITEMVKNGGLDLKSASAARDAIVYEQFGSLHILDLKSGKTSAVNVSLSADLAEVRGRFEKIISRTIENAAISPTGKRAVLEAHGEILTLPVEKGDIRNLTNSPAVAERDPAWSPDGNSIAYFSDESGEYALHIRDQTGLGAVTKIDLGRPPSFFYSPKWSPDSKKIAYYDKRLNLWYVDLDKKAPVHVDSDLVDSPGFDFRPAWSPDSRWITYAKQLPNNLHAVFVYQLDGGKTTQVTDGMSDASAPVFDKDGKSLYFLASTNIGLSRGWIEMTSIGHPQTSAVYVAVLRKDLPSPLAPQSDDENADKKDENKKDDGKKDDAKKDSGADKKSGAAKKGGAAKDEANEPPPPEVRIDFESISQRILAVPVPERNYFAVIPGKAGVIYVVERPLWIPVKGRRRSQLASSSSRLAKPTPSSLA